jgi:predicted RNase H-like nuclease (RuvC/YqgF family)
MKKLMAVSIFGMLFLSIGLPLSWAVKNEATGTGMSGTPAEFSNMEKTLGKDRIDMIETRLSDLKQENRFLSERVKMLERSVNDLKDKVDRSFR